MGSLSKYKNLIEYAKSNQSQVLINYKDLIKSLTADGIKYKNDKDYNIANTLSRIVQSELSVLKGCLPFFSISYLNDEIYTLKGAYDLTEDMATIYAIIDVFAQIPQEYYTKPITNNQNKYILVQWPESQYLMEHKRFDECLLIDNIQNHIDVGSSAYMCPEELYNEIFN